MTKSPTTLALRAIKQHPSRLGRYALGALVPGTKSHSVVRNNWQTNEIFVSRDHNKTRYQVMPAGNLVKLKD